MRVKPKEVKLQAGTEKQDTFNQEKAILNDKIAALQEEKERI